MPNNYDEVQEKLLLALSSHGGADCSAPAGPELNYQVAEGVKKVLKDWKLYPDWHFVWGPAAAVAPGRHLNSPETPVHAANVMYAAYNNATGSLFISVSATNDNAWYDLKEDFRVHVLKPWPLLPEGSTEQPKISAGSVLALRLLRAMTPTPPQPGAGQTLPEWLKDFVAEKGKTRITVGGQSLGGILSPLVALWLWETKDDWNHDGVIEQSDFHCWRVAGPTPGDGAFKTYYEARVPNTVNLINRRDTAPLMFDEAAMSKLPDLYDPIRPGPRMRAIIAAFMADVAGMGYTQVGTDSERSFEAAIPPNLGGKTECLRWTNQMGYHHLGAYIVGVGLGKPADYVGEDNVHQFNILCTRPNRLT